MNEGKARQRQDRAAKAEALLRNELFVEAFEYLDEQFIEAWKTSGVDDSEAREKLFHLMQALGAVRGIFKAWLRMVSWQRSSLMSSDGRAV